MVSFAGCMRNNGVPNFPDPKSDGTFSFDSLKQLGIGTPRFQTAFKTCQPLEPKVGPRIVFGAGNIEERRPSAGSDGPQTALLMKIAFSSYPRDW